MKYIYILFNNNLNIINKGRCDFCYINRFLHVDVFNRKNSGLLKMYSLFFNLFIQYNI